MWWRRRLTYYSFVPSSLGLRWWRDSAVEGGSLSVVIFLLGSLGLIESARFAVIVSYPSLKGVFSVQTMKCNLGIFPWKEQCCDDSAVGCLTSLFISMIPYNTCN